MTVENQGSGNNGKVWVRSSSLLPVILPCSPPSTFSIQSLAKLRKLVEESGEGWDVDRIRWEKLTFKVLGIQPLLADIYFETSQLELNKGSSEDTCPFHLLLTTLFLQLSWQARDSPGEQLRATEEEAVGHWLRANVQHLLRLVGTPHPARDLDLKTLLFSHSQAKGPQFSSSSTKGIKFDDDQEGTLVAIRKGKRLAWQLEVVGEHRSVVNRLKELHCDERQSDDVNSQNVVAVRNHAKLAISAPESTVPTIVVSQLLRQVLARKGGAVTGARLVVHRCRQSRLYFLAHLASVTVTKCTESKVFFGAVSGTLTLTRCRGLSVTAACARLVVRDCHDLSISVLTPLNPLVSASSTQVRFAPLCSTYTGMRQDLLAARLKVNHAGKWNHPFVLEEESTVNEVNSGPCVNISTPECFHMIDLPLQGVGKSDCSLAKLPDEFQDEAEKKRERVKLWETLEGDLHPSQMVELQKRVNDKFSAFLAQRCQLSNSPLV